MELRLLSPQLIATCNFNTSTPSPRLDGGESSRLPKLGPPPCLTGDQIYIYNTIRRGKVRRHVRDMVPRYITARGGCHAIPILLRGTIVNRTK